MILFNPGWLPKNMILVALKMTEILWVEIWSKWNQWSVFSLPHSSSPLSSFLLTYKFNLNSPDNSATMKIELSSCRILISTETKISWGEGEEVKSIFYVPLFHFCV